MKYCYLVLLILIGSLSACKKDRGAVTPAPTIVGKWYLKQHRSQVFKNNVTLTDDTRTDFIATDFELFNGDGTAITSSNTAGGLTSLVQYNYLFEGNTLQVNRNTSTFALGNYDVVTLSETTLVLHYESADIVDGVKYRGIDDFKLNR